jgi:hypothetical protein
MTKDIQKTALRLPRELHTAILDAASKSGRTMNAEIVYRLQQSIEQAQQMDNEAIKELNEKGYRSINLRIANDMQLYQFHLNEALRKIEDGLKAVHDVMGEASQKDEQ